MNNLLLFGVPGTGLLLQGDQWVLTHILNRSDHEPGVMKEVEYRCVDCEDIHTAIVVESLPNRPLAYKEIGSLTENSGIQAARGHETFRIYQGDDDKYRDEYTDMMVIVYDEIARLLRFIPNAGWAIEDEREVIPNDDPEVVIDQLFEDREQGVY